MKIFTTEDHDKIIDEFHKGYAITRTNNFLYQGQPGTIKANVRRSLTYKEIQEFSMCSNDIIYFIEKYCKIKLYDFQKEWVNLFINNDHLIYCTSRQVGYSHIMSAIYLWYCIFNIDKTIQIITRKIYSAEDMMNNVWQKYLLLPFFMKPGIKSRNKRKIIFDNTSKIFSGSSKVIPDMKTDLYNISDFAHIPFKYKTHLYKDIMSMSDNPKIIIQSGLNGHEFFNELLLNSERKDGDPLKNQYTSIKTYWWEVPGRDDKWKQEQIKILGSELAWKQEYDLQTI